ncbi:uncharacterized protein IWZ02DRAFT_461232 [Phyllosticta citriasiana]|uniref:uncharacterized protein n=1 Tax=Phyllosticta citriasiana TaxID=595635 RepID=UPI0030FDDA01
MQLFASRLLQSRSIADSLASIAPARHFRPTPSTSSIPLLCRPTTTCWPHLGHVLKACMHGGCLRLPSPVDKLTQTPQTTDGIESTTGTRSLRESAASPPMLDTVTLRIMTPDLTAPTCRPSGHGPSPPDSLLIAEPLKSAPNSLPKDCSRFRLEHALPSPLLLKHARCVSSPTTSRPPPAISLPRSVSSWHSWDPLCILHRHGPAHHHSGKVGANADSGSLYINLLPTAPPTLGLPSRRSQAELLLLSKSLLLEECSLLACGNQTP